MSQTERWAACSSHAFFHITSRHIPHHITSHHSVPPFGLLRNQTALPVTRYVLTCPWSYLSLVHNLWRRGHITHPLFYGEVCFRLWKINCSQFIDHANSRTASPAQSNLSLRLKHETLISEHHWDVQWNTARPHAGLESNNGYFRGTEKGHRQR